PPPTELYTLSLHDALPIYLNKSLGTRHRAAIGLTEETDAVVVAVSEETGAISYAYKGQLTRGLSLEELRALIGLCKRRKSRRSRSEEHTSELQSRGHLVCR